MGTQHLTFYPKLFQIDILQGFVHILLETHRRILLVALEKGHLTIPLVNPCFYTFEKERESRIGTYPRIRRFCTNRSWVLRQFPLAISILIVRESLANDQFPH